MFMLGVWALLTTCDQLQLHVFVFDETLQSLRVQGSVTGIDLSPWYTSQAGISILQLAFVSGKEELVLVDSISRARIFSFISLQIRYAPQNFVISHPILLTSSEDRLSCLFRHFPTRYFRLLMVHAS
jgi:hypothetical protein